MDGFAVPRRRRGDRRPRRRPAAASGSVAGWRWESRPARAGRGRARPWPSRPAATCPPAPTPWSWSEDTVPSAAGRACGCCRAVDPGRHVVRLGRRRSGRQPTVLPAGRRLGARRDGRAGRLRRRPAVPVYRRPRVAVLSTGSELCPPGRAAAPGRQGPRREPARRWPPPAEAAGLRPSPRAGIVPDDPDAAGAQAVRAAAGRVTTRGPALGRLVGRRPRPHRRGGRRGWGELLFHGIDVAPGPADPGRPPGSKPHLRPARRAGRRADHLPGVRSARAPRACRGSGGAGDRPADRRGWRRRTPRARVARTTCACA